MTLSTVGWFALAAIAYVLISFYMRARIGPQPGYAGLLTITAAMSGVLITFHTLQRFGIDLMHGRPRDVFWLILGLLWLVLAGRMLHQRLSSGVVLMDLGPAPMFKLQIASAVLLLVVAISLVIDSESYVQAFAYSTWAAWFLVMARGRFAVRDRGIVAGEFLPWSRITGCVVTGDDAVRMQLSRGPRRTVTIRIPPGRRDAFIDLVNRQKEAAPT
jgi:hypothetical protein